MLVILDDTKFKWNLPFKKSLKEILIPPVKKDMGERVEDLK
jgi:hypothetical protein